MADAKGVKMTKVILSEYEEDVLLNVVGLWKGNSTLPVNEIIYGAALNQTMEFLSGLGFLARRTYQLTSKGQDKVTEIINSREGSDNG